MGRYLDREWVSRFADGGRPRSETREGTYQAYLPDLLVGRDFTFSADAAADLADAERAIARLDAEARALVDTEGLARLLLRAEAVSSSHIEGLTISAQRLLRYDLARREGDEITDDTASQVLANVDALAFAFADAGAKITVPRILEVHRRLLRPTRLAEHAGVIRTVQNWIGGNTYTPCGAAFVPPPPEYVAELLTDLCAFANGDGLPATAQAAIAHAQFETIHPFVDGNGRTGRALMYMILRKRGLALRVTPPISLILATEAQGYVRALQATRFTDDPLAGNKAINAWIGVFASACSRAVRDAESFESRVAAIIADWEPRLAAMRSDASAHRLLALLPRTPIVSTRSVEEALGVTYAAANAAIAALVAHEILTPARAGRRNRVFEARDILDAFTELERRTASRTADTQVSPLERDVPARPQRR